MEDIGATATRIVLGALSSHIDDDNVERRETTDVADIMDAFELAGVVRRIGVDDLDGGNRRPGGSVGLTPTGAVCVRRLLAADCDARCGRKVRRLQRDGPAVVHRWEGLPHRQRGGDGVACCPPARRSSRPDVRCGSGARRSSLAGWPTRRARRSPSDAARGVLPEPHAPGGPIFQTPNAGATCCIRRHQVSKVDGDTMPLRWGMAYQRPNIADVGLEIGNCLCVGDDSGALRLAFRCVELVERAPVDDRQDLVASEPVPTGDERYDALLAAITQYLCVRQGRLAPPGSRIRADSSINGGSYRGCSPCMPTRSYTARSRLPGGVCSSPRAHWSSPSHAA